MENILTAVTSTGSLRFKTHTTLNYLFHNHNFIVFSVHSHIDCDWLNIMEVIFTSNQNALCITLKLVIYIKKFIGEVGNYTFTQVTQLTINDTINY